jgi:hypothetical protein
MDARSRRSRACARVVFALTALLGCGLASTLTSLLLLAGTPVSPCAGAGGSAAPAATGVVEVGPDAIRVGATEYGGPGDPSSGDIGASGIDLVSHPDSYAELGGATFDTADAMGGLPYMTPLRISWDGRSAIAYKRDIGLGGGPIDGLPRVVDLWWQFAGALGIPYDEARWSGAVSISRPPPGGAGNLLGQTAQAVVAPVQAGGACAVPAADALALAPGDRAQLLPDGQAAAPSDAPVAVKGIIAAGNAIVGRPYVYGAGHGLPLDQLSPAYDCSSSVEHLLYGGGLLPVGYAAASSALESFGDPGPGRWVTIYASADHVFMYVAGLRWDTHNAAGPQDGSAGIGWHPLIRNAAGFVVRHPVGL